MFGIKFLEEKNSSSPVDKHSSEDSKEETKSSLPSIIIDPFNKESISSIFIHYRKPTRFSKNGWSASVEFTSGNTSGEQKTKQYDMFEDLISEIKSILEEVKNK